VKPALCLRLDAMAAQRAATSLGARFLGGGAGAFWDFRDGGVLRHTAGGALADIGDPVGFVAPRAGSAEALQGTSASRPVRTASGLVFNGANQWLDSQIVGGGEGTIIAGLQTTGAGNFDICGARLDANWMTRARCNSSHRPVMRAGSLVAIGNTDHQASPRVVAFTWSSGEVSVHVDGAEEDRGTGATAPSAGLTLHIGSSNGIGSDFEGTISFIGIVDRVLTVPEIAGLSAELAL